jgi:hypothetical protein
VTVTQAEPETDQFAAFQARNALIRNVRERLKGRNLDFRELRSELVISYPGHPERGRIYIDLRTGEVSRRRTVWDCLGYWPGYADSGMGDTGVDADTIVGTLTGNGDSQ